MITIYCIKTNMSLYISKIIRTLSKDRIPSTCYAYQWFPQSLTQVCDCKVFCKFPPKGNIGMPIVAYNHNHNHNTNKKSEIVYKYPMIPNPLKI